MAKLPAKTRRRRQSAVANAPRLGPYECAIVWLLVAAACLPGVAAVLAAPEAASIVAGVTAVAATFRAIILGRFRPFASARALAGLVVAAKRRLVGQPQPRAAAAAAAAAAAPAGVGAANLAELRGAEVAAGSGDPELEVRIRPKAPPLAQLRAPSMRFHERFAVLYGVALLCLLPVAVATRTDAAAGVGASGLAVLIGAVAAGAAGAAAAAGAGAAAAPAASPVDRAVSLRWLGGFVAAHRGQRFSVRTGAQRLPREIPAINLLRPVSGRSVSRANLCPHPRPACALYGRAGWLTARFGARGRGSSSGRSSWRPRTAAATRAASTSARARSPRTAPRGGSPSARARASRLRCGTRTSRSRS
jgi:hypothetical protein